MRIYPGYPVSSPPDRREFLRRAVLGMAAVPLLSSCFEAPAGGGEQPGGNDTDDTDDTDQSGDTCDATTDDIEGPYYRNGAPYRTNLAPAGALGDAFIITGVIAGLDCQPLAGAVVDVWHADHDGGYDNSSADYLYRGKVTTGADGRYRFDTIYPGAYATGPTTFRPAHVHFKVSHSGVLLTTQLYFEGDQFLDDDPWAEPSRTVPLTDQDGVLQAIFDVALAV